MTLPRVHLPTIPDDGVDDSAVDAANGRVSRFDVERFACGELKGDAAARVQQALDADPALKAFFEEVRADDAAFLVQQPPRAFIEKITPQTTTPWARAAGFVADLRLQLTAGALAAAAVVAVVVLPATGPATDPADGPIRSKGAERQPAVSFFVKEAGGARVGVAGETLAPGDQIQLAVTDVSKRALVVVGVDSAGVVSVYAAEESTTTGKGEPGPRPLPTALVLDDTTGSERFFVVYGDSLATTEATARAAAGRLAEDVKAGRADLARVSRLAVDDDAFPQASIHILKVR